MSRQVPLTTAIMLFLACNSFAQDNPQQFAIGKEKPVWWYNIWFSQSVILKGKVHSNKRDENQDIFFDYVLGEHKQKRRLIRVPMTIAEVVDLPDGVNYLHSGIFQKNGNIFIYLEEKYFPETRNWLGHTYNPEEDVIIFLKPVGVLKPGAFYAEGRLEANMLDKLKFVIQERDRKKGVR